MENIDIEDDYFVLYSCWEFLLKRLPKEDVGILFLAIFDYAIDGKIPDFGTNSALNLAFCAIADQIDYERNK